MGPCTSTINHRSKRSLPIAFHSQKTNPKQQPIEDHQFQFELSNVSIVPTSTSKIEISFAIDGIKQILLEKTNKITQVYASQQTENKKQQYELKWNQISKIQFSMNQKQLTSRYLNVYLRYDNQDPIQVIKISLYLIVNGPFHHNIQIPFAQENFRISFDAKISHIFEIDLKTEELKLNLNADAMERFNSSLYNFSIKAFMEEEIISQSFPSYSINIQESKQKSKERQNFYCEERPSAERMIKIHRSISMEEIKTYALDWQNSSKTKREQNVMPQLTFDSSTLEITRSFIQILVWSVQERQAKYICEAKIPLWKLFDRQFMKEENKQRQKLKISSFDERAIKLNQKLYSHHEFIGNCEIQFNLKNEKLIEQSKYCSRTQDGIVNLRPATINKNIQSNNKIIHQIWKLAQDIQKVINKANQKVSMEEIETEIEKTLLKLHQKLSSSSSEVLYSDANKFEALINNQNIFIDLIKKLYPFIEDAQNTPLSEISWAIIISFLKRKEFSLQNLSLTGLYKTPQSQNILKRKKQIAFKYQQQIYRLITYALKSYGLYNSNNNMLSRFLALAYFRVALFRNYCLEIINFEEQYLQMENRLIVFQKQIEPKTSFSSNFADIKGDWQLNFYDQLQKMPQSKQLNKELVSNFKSKNFFMELSFKDSSMYTFFSLLLKSLSIDSLQKADKWKYIEGYSKIVAVVLTQLKQKQINKYSQGLIRTSTQILGNQHLISQILPLICDKTNVYNAENMQIVLDMLESFLQATTKGKQIQFPNTFNHNYFFKIMRTILEGEGFYAINRFLVIVYQYFDLFTLGVRFQIAMYLMGKVFFHLFYHWSNEVRYTFYLILEIRVKHINIPRSAQVITHFNKVIAATKVIQGIYQKYHTKPNSITEITLFKKMKFKIQDKIKNKHGTKSQAQKRKEFLLSNIFKGIEDDAFLGAELRQLSRFCQQFQNTPNKNAGFSNSRDGMFLQQPQVRLRTRSDDINSVEQLQLPNLNLPTVSTPNEYEHRKSADLKRGQVTVRKKRRPSVFIQNAISPNPKAQTTQKISNSIHDLTQLEDDQIKNIGYAANQYEQVIQQVEKYCQNHNGKLPNSQYLQFKKSKISQ